jgi:uncharacterized membrane protein YhdT
MENPVNLNHNTSRIPTWWKLQYSPIICIIVVSLCYILGGWCFRTLDDARGNAIAPVRPFVVTRPPLKDLTWSLALLMDPSIRQVQAREYMNANEASQTLSDAHMAERERSALTILSVFQFVIYGAILCLFVALGRYERGLESMFHASLFLIPMLFFNMCYILGGFRYRTIDDARSSKLSPSRAFEVDSVPVMDPMWVLSLIDVDMRKATARLYMNGTGASADGDEARLNASEKKALNTLSICQFVFYLAFTVFISRIVYLGHRAAIDGNR